MRRPVNIVCVKTGTKYTHKDVKRLYKMVERTCSLPFIFYCLTDNIYDLPSNVVGIKVNSSLDLESYWWKICLFNLNWNEKILYFDLDIVIQKDFTYLFEKIKKNKILVINPDDAGINISNDIILDYDAFINSSIIGMYPKDHEDVYNLFLKNIDYNILKYFGLDRFLSDRFLNRCIYLDFYNDYYFRWKDDKTPTKFCTPKIIDNTSYFLAKDPNKTLCIISQVKEEMYEGLEEYFI